MNSQPNEKRRGRPAGSNSFVRVRITDLISLVGDGAVIPVSKVWLRENGIGVAEAVTLNIPAAQPPVENEEKISFSLTTFD